MNGHIGKRVVMNIGVLLALSCAMIGGVLVQHLVYSEENAPPPADPLLDFKRILNEISVKQIVTIDALTKQDREILRSVFTDYFNKIRGPAYSNPDTLIINQEINTGFVVVVKLFMGKPVDDILDTFGKPMSIVSRHEGFIVIYYLGKTNIHVLNFGKIGDLISQGAGSTYLPSNPNK